MSSLHSITTDTVVAPENPPSYHPSYCDEDASLILSSSDNVLFRVHPAILQLASEIFRNMLSDAQDTKEPILLEENSEVLAAILDLIYPNGKDFNITGKTFEFVWKLLNAADKYGIIKITNMFRNRLFTHPFFTTRPVESYAIACRFSWTEEIVITAILCIDYVNAPASSKILGLLDASHVLRLHKLIFTRNDKFQKIWDSTAFDGSIWANSETHRNYDSYKSILLSLVQQELAKCPSGKIVKAEFWYRSEIKFLISSPYQIEKAKAKILTILNSLPTTVEEEEERHLFLTTKIITDETFQRHQGFDLANFDENNRPPTDLPSFRILKTTPYHTFKGRVASHFNFHESQFRLCALLKRQNKTLRTDTHIPENEPTPTMDVIRNNLANRTTDLRLYLDVISDPNPAPGSVMVFLKHFDTSRQTLLGVGKTYVQRNARIGSLSAFVNEHMRWPAGTPLKLYEEIKPGMIELLKLETTFAHSEIWDGDIICFQVEMSADEAHVLRVRGLCVNPPQFYDFLQNRDPAQI